MNFFGDAPLTLLANASVASNAMQAYVSPVMATLCAIASLACVFFLVHGGIQYSASTGKPEKLDHAKKIIRNALIGLVLVIAAGTLTAILSQAYGNGGGTMAEKLPEIAIIEKEGGFDWGTLLIKAIVELFRYLIQSAGEPFVNALGYFTNSTPLMGDSSTVFNMWLAIVGIADIAFILIVTLIGFHVMSFASLGLEEIELKHLFPQFAFVFLLMNTSIFMIDGIISLSNAMIHALQSGFVSISLWDTLGEITKKSADIGLAGLVIMVAFLVLTVMLLVYYVGRLITLYIGAILSPLVLMLWLLPAFKDFALAALKVYLTTIFVLFVHVVIILLASSIFRGVLNGDDSGQTNTLIAMIVGLATLLALLKTQGVMQELSYAASTPRAAREVASSFMKGVGYLNKGRRGAVSIVKGSRKNTDQSQNDGQTKTASGNRPTIVRMEHTKPAKSPKPTTGLKTGETRKATPLENKR